MLTEQQAHELNLQQHALEAAEIWYNRTQAKLDEYNSMLASIRDNYSSYTPEQQEKVSSLMDKVTQDYQALKKQREDYSLARYEAQQQINYYNDLSAKQQPAPQAWQKRRAIQQPTWEVIEEVVVTPEWETIVQPEIVVDTNKENPYLKLYDLYSKNVVDGKDPSGLFVSLYTEPSKITNWMLDAWLSMQQVSGFMNDWQRNRPDINLSSNQRNYTVPRRQMEIPQDFAYTPWMSLKWTSKTLWHGTLVPKWYVNSDFSATHPLRGVGNWTGTLY